MTAEIGHNTGIAKEEPATRFAKGQLKAIIERIERLDEEKKTISDDIRDVYGEAKGKGLFEKDAYLMKNHKEYFAVTASIFLSGKDSTHEPHTRAKLKEKHGVVIE